MTRSREVATLDPGRAAGARRRPADLRRGARPAGRRPECSPRPQVRRPGDDVRRAGRRHLGGDSSGAGGRGARCRTGAGDDVGRPRRGGRTTLGPGSASPSCSSGCRSDSRVAVCRRTASSGAGCPSSSRPGGCVAATRSAIVANKWLARFGVARWTPATRAAAARLDRRRAPAAAALDGAIPSVLAGHDQPGARGRPDSATATGPEPRRMSAGQPFGRPVGTFGQKVAHTGVRLAPARGYGRTRGTLSVFVASPRVAERRRPMPGTRGCVDSSRFFAFSPWCWGSSRCSWPCYHRSDQVEEQQLLLARLYPDWTGTAEESGRAIEALRDAGIPAVSLQALVDARRSPAARTRRRRDCRPGGHGGRGRASGGVPGPSPPVDRQPGPGDVRDPARGRLSRLVRLVPPCAPSAPRAAAAAVGAGGAGRQRRASHGARQEQRRPHADPRRRPHRHLREPRIRARARLLAGRAHRPRAARATSTKTTCPASSSSSPACATRTTKTSSSR